MAINLVCGHCWSTHKLDTQVCPKCRGVLTGVKRKYRVRVRKPEGGWKTKTVKSLKAARGLETKWDFQGVMGIEDKPATQVPTIGAIWLAFYAWAVDNKATHADDLGRYTRHIAPTIGSKRMNAVTPGMIDAILAGMRRGVGRVAPGQYADASLVQVVALVKRLYNWAGEKDLYHGTNPADRVTVPKFDNRITRWLTQEEIKDLLEFVDAWGNPRAALVIKYALASGRRRGDIISLKWLNITKNFQHVEYPGDATKNGTTNYLPLNQTCRDILAKAWEIRKGDLVFPARTGRRYHSFDKTWQRIRTKAGFSYRFHDLRHTFASYLASSGQVDIYTLQKLLGHKDIKMTQRYAHLIDSALSKCVNVVDTALDIPV